MVGDRIDIEIELASRDVRPARRSRNRGCETTLQNRLPARLGPRAGGNARCVIAYVDTAHLEGGAMAQRTPRLDRRALVAAGLVLQALTLTACGQLELDREAGTAFPGSVMVNGTLVTLPSIYDAIGIPLEVIEDEVVNVGVESTLSCVSDAELDSFEAGHRGLPVEPTCPFCEFRLYGAIVNRLYSAYDGSLPCVPCDAEGEGLCTAGVMWTDNRRAFAVFGQHASIANDPGFLLLVAAHEAGHALGVHHADGNEDFDNPSLENDGLYFWYTNGSYEFTAQSREHIREHPFPCKWPGTGSFWEVMPEHAAWPGHGVFRRNLSVAARGSRGRHSMHQRFTVRLAALAAAIAAVVWAALPAAQTPPQEPLQLVLEIGKTGWWSASRSTLRCASSTPAATPSRSGRASSPRAAPSGSTWSRRGAREPRSGR